MGTGTVHGTGQRPIICQSSAAGRCAGRGCALIRQLAHSHDVIAIPISSPKAIPIPTKIPIPMHISILQVIYCTDTDSQAIKKNTPNCGHIFKNMPNQTHINLNLNPKAQLNFSTLDFLNFRLKSMKLPTKHCPYNAPLSRCDQSGGSSWPRGSSPFSRQERNANRCPPFGKCIGGLCTPSWPTNTTVPPVLATNSS